MRSLMTFAQASLARNLAGVERIEVVPVLYPRCTTRPPRSA